MAEPPPSHAIASLRRHAGAHTAHGLAHVHAHVQLLLGLSGLLELEIDGRAACIGANGMLRIPAGVQLAYRTTRPARIRVVDAPAYSVPAELW